MPCVNYSTGFTASAILQALAITVKAIGVPGIDGKIDESTIWTRSHPEGLPRQSV
jgi:hypothetical protein